MTTRRMEQSIFKTIVEMANEMDYADKRQKNTDWVFEIMNRTPVETRLDTRANLRSLTAKPTDPHKHETSTFRWKGRPYRLTFCMKYQRFLNENNRVRERGRCHVLIREKQRDGTYTIVFDYGEASYIWYYDNKTFNEALETLKQRLIPFMTIYL